MSAAGRSSAARTGHTRHAGDLYETPPSVVRAILPHLPLAGRVLEPSAGRGAIVRVLLEAGKDCTAIHAVELNDDNARAVSTLGVCTHFADFLDRKETEGLECFFDLIVGNPPYRDAEAHVRRALECVKSSGTVAMLLRLGFLESQSRAAFHREHPCDVYVLPKRPSFTGDGRADAAAYMWAVWGPSRGHRWFRLDDG